MPESPSELDIRSMPPELRHGRVFQAFDALRPGEALVLVNDHDPMPLLQQFKFVRPGQSESEYLERGPTAWRVRIARRGARPAAAPGAATEPPRTVTEYLEGDHRRLDAILPGVERLVSQGAYGDAATRFAEFAGGLDRHIEAEERVLFPEFEARTGMCAGPTAVMRSEHVDIRHGMRRVSEAIAAREPAAVGEALGSLARILGLHNMKEERMLYPMTDQVVGDDAARADLVRRLQAV